MRDLHIFTKNTKQNTYSKKHEPKHTLCPEEELNILADVELKRSIDEISRLLTSENNKACGDDFLK